MAHSAEFRIIRYEPDQRRGERVNVGLVLLLPEGPRVFMGRSPAKAQALSPQTTLHEMQSELQEFFHDSWSALGEDPARFVAATQVAGPFVLSRAGYMGLDGRSLEQAVASALKRLVDAPKRQSTREGRTRLHTEIKKRFRDSGVLATDAAGISQHQVVAGFELPGDDELVADFAYRNGSWHLTQVVDYRTSPKAAAGKIKEVSVKAITLDQATRDTKRLLGDVMEVMPYAAVFVPPELEKAVAPQLEIMRTYCNELFRFERAKEADNYWRLMRSVVGVRQAVP